MPRLPLALLVVVPGLLLAEVQQAPFPPELVRFVPRGKEPVFTAGGPGQWDAKIRERGWVLRDGDGWKLWYTGYDGSKEGRRLLGLATSPDGITWTRHPANPIHRDHWVEDVMVVRDAGTYYLFAEGEQDRAHLLTSKDGVRWQRVGPLDVRRKDGTPIPDGPYGTPTALKKGSTWYLFYERGDRGVWLAASADLKVWKNVQDEPVLTPGPGLYDRDLIALNQVVEHGGRYYAYYHGAAGPKARFWSTAVAVSTDLLHWEKYPGNPLFPIEENRSSGIVVHDGQGFRLYTMHPEVHLHVPAR